jgi:hypothetical protein
MGRKEERLASAPEVSELGLGASKAYGGPKKQYVREYGWKDVIHEFVKIREAEGLTQPIRYLTLAGANATDIGILYRAGLLQLHQGKLQVAICDKDNALNIQNSLRTTVGEVLVATTKDLHKALRDENDDLVQMFPFDVINCDFCDTALKCIPDDDSYPNIESINKIFEYQRGKDFLLFLTSRAMAAVHPDILDVIKDNLEIAEFNNAYVEVYGDESPQKCTKDLTQFSLIIYSKLIAKFAKNFGYKISDKFVAKYDRGKKDGRYYMITMSFFLESQFSSRTPQRKYEPKFTRRQLLLNGNRIPDYMLKKAEELYGPYVVQLLNARNVLNISELLEQNTQLSARLEKREQGYDRWWMR